MTTDQPIARIWRGAVRRDDADRYADYLRATGVKEYAETPGNRGVLMLRRDRGDLVEFVLVTLWDSLDAVRGFAGDDVERAVFYPEDDAFLVERDLSASHFELLDSTVDGRT
jgi:heme-degrading monooxygenase HmoA